MSDSVSRSLWVGGIITKIANYFGITLKNFLSMPPPFLDENLLKNSRKFKHVRGLQVWKNEEGDDDVGEELAQDLKDIEQIRTHGLQIVQI